MITLPAAMWFPYQRVQLHSHCDVAEVRNRLGAVVELGGLSSFGKWGGPGTKPFRGRLEATAFKMILLPDAQRRKSYAPIVTGNFNSTANGTRIDLTLRLRASVVVLCTLWSGAVLSFAIQHGLRQGTVYFFASLLLACSIVAFLAGLTMVSFKADAQRALAALRNALGCP